MKGLRRTHRRPRERGYIIATTAIMLVPMMVFAAMAVDIGAWTAQTTRAQNAADAAALAGAPLLPNQPQAEAVARAVATQNGYTHDPAPGGRKVVVTFPDNQTIRVEITDSSELYFSNVVTNQPIPLTRFADATAISPVTMGSPTNVLGFGPNSLDGVLAPSNYWLLENNECSVAHYGDIRAAKYLDRPWCDDNEQISGSGSIPNPYWKLQTDGRDGGYFYVVEVPPGMTNTSRLWIMDPGKCPGYGTKPADEHHNGNADQGTRLRFRQWSTNNTPLITGDDTPVSGPQGSWTEYTDCVADLPYGAGAWTDKTQGWTSTHFTFPPNTTGEVETHLIQTSVFPSKRRGWNHYAFWVRPEGTSTACLTIGVNNCPTIGGEDWVPTRSAGPGNDVPMNLYLAEVGPEHAGKTMNVVLWDVGEGMDNIQVLDPNGTSLDFTWDSDDPAPAPPGYGIGQSSHTCGSNPCLYLDPVNSNYPRKLPHPGWNNHWRYNGRIMTLNVPLDSQVDYPAYATSPNGYWFSIQFNPASGNTAREWATFSVRITGDPIRLID